MRGVLTMVNPGPTVLVVHASMSLLELHSTLASKLLVHDLVFA